MFILKVSSWENWQLYPYFQTFLPNFYFETDLGYETDRLNFSCTISRTKVMTPEEYAVSDKEFELTKKRKMWIKLKITSFLGTKRALFRGGTPFPIRVALQLQLLLLLLRPLIDEIHGGTPTLIRGITPLQSFVIL